MMINAVEPIELTASGRTPASGPSDAWASARAEYAQLTSPPERASIDGSWKNHEVTMQPSQYRTQETSAAPRLSNRLLETLASYSPPHGLDAMAAQVMNSYARPVHTAQDLASQMYEQSRLSAGVMAALSAHHVVTSIAATMVSTFKSLLTNSSA